MVTRQEQVQPQINKEAALAFTEFQFAASRPLKPLSNEANDREMEPRIVQEAVELQTAVGLVAAEIGITIVPESVKRLRRDDIVYLDFEEVSVTSPIIMSRRAGDDSKQVGLMDQVILQAYKEWGWSAPQGIGAR